VDCLAANGRDWAKCQEPLKRFRTCFAEQTAMREPVERGGAAPARARDDEPRR